MYHFRLCTYFLCTKPDRVRGTQRRWWWLEAGTEAGAGADFSLHQHGGMADTAWVIAKAVVSCGAGSCAKRNIWRKKGTAKGTEVERERQREKWNHFLLGISQYFSLIKRKLGNTFDIDQSPDNLYNSISLLSLQYFSSFMAHCSCVSVGCCHYTHTYTHTEFPHYIFPFPLCVCCLLLLWVLSICNWSAPLGLCTQNCFACQLRVVLVVVFVALAAAAAAAGLYNVSFIGQGHESVALS